MIYFTELVDIWIEGCRRRTFFPHATKKNHATNKSLEGCSGRRTLQKSWFSSTKPSRQVHCVNDPITTKFIIQWSFVGHLVILWLGWSSIFDLLVVMVFIKYKVRLWKKVIVFIGFKWEILLGQVQLWSKNFKAKRVLFRWIQGMRTVK